MQKPNWLPPLENFDQKRARQNTSGRLQDNQEIMSRNLQWSPSSTDCKKLTTWQGKPQAEIHREIARRNAKKTKRSLTKAELMKEAERIKKAVRTYRSEERRHTANRTKLTRAQRRLQNARKNNSAK